MKCPRTAKTFPDRQRFPLGGLGHFKETMPSFPSGAHLLNGFCRHGGVIAEVLPDLCGQTGKHPRQQGPLDPFRGRTIDQRKKTLILTQSPPRTEKLEPRKTGCWSPGPTGEVSVFKCKLRLLDISRTDNLGRTSHVPDATTCFACEKSKPAGE